MKIQRVGSRLLQILAIGFLTSYLHVARATPYASCITNDGSGNITFFLNESGGSVAVYYEDHSVATVYTNGVAVGSTNAPLLSGACTFSLGVHSSYSIAVSENGTGVASLEPNVIQNTNLVKINLGAGIATNALESFGNIADRGLRGLAVNVNPASPYFGRIYVSRGGGAAGDPKLYDLNSDGSWSTAGSGGSTLGYTNWSLEFHAVSPDRISIAPNDDVVVGDQSSANAGVWLADPNLTTNTLLLGPVGDLATNSSGSIVHGEDTARPWLVGDLNTGATLLTVDGDFPNSQPGSILIYSNITTSALASGTGWTNPPDLIGPQITLNLNQYIGGPGYYFMPSLWVGPNGYLYAGEYRNWPDASTDPADVQVYDSSGNALWNSRYNGGNSDYFATAAAGGSTNLTSDLAVSPDGKYLAVVAADNHLTICVLTNGIPDVSTIYTIAPEVYGAEQSYGFADEVAWDAADNIYVLSAYNDGLTVWTLGQSATCTTTGNASGATGYTNIYPATVVTLTVGAATISQENPYDNPTNTTFTVTRVGDTTTPLTVNFTMSGTAVNGTEYTLSAAGTNVTIAAGQTSTNITITAVSDGIPRVTTIATMALTSPVGYSLGTHRQSVTILNAAQDVLTASVGAPTVYNAFSNDYASVTITRLGDLQSTYTVNNFNLAGTAMENTDYAPPTPVTFNPGDAAQIVYFYPLIDGQLPVHTNNMVYTGNKTIIVSIGDDPGHYTGATNTATLNIIDSANPTATVLYYNPLTNADDATNWNVTGADGNMPAVDPASNYQIDFGYDLTANSSDPGSTYGVTMPFPPSGAPWALRVTANKTASENTGVNLYPTNVAFSGNYAVRFNMNIVEGSNPSSTTEGAMFGINHNGMETNWWSGSGVTGTSLNWASDGIWCWVSADGGAGLGDYIVFTGNGGTWPNTPANGWELLAQLKKASFVNAFKTNVFTTDGGPGLAANESPDNADDPSDYSSWSDVELKQMNGVVTISIDKTPIFVYTNTTVFTNGTIMFGYEDPFDSLGGADAAAYFSDLRVVRLTPPLISETAYNSVDSTFVFDFTTTDGDLTTSSFVVQGASVVTGPYTDIPSATITQLSNGAFQATVPASGSVQFYRIRQQ